MASLACTSGLNTIACWPMEIIDWLSTRVSPFFLDLRVKVSPLSNFRK